MLAHFAKSRRTYCCFCGCKFIHISANVLLYPKALSNTNTNRKYSLYKQNGNICTTKGSSIGCWKPYSIPTGRADIDEQREILKNILSTFAFKQTCKQMERERERERECEGEEEMQKILFAFYATLENTIARALLTLPHRQNSAPYICIQ